MKSKKIGKHAHHKSVLAKAAFIIIVLSLTVMVPIAAYTQFLLSSISLVVYTPPINNANLTQTNSTTNSSLNFSPDLRTAPPGVRFIRIRTLDNPNFTNNSNINFNGVATWVLPNYTAQNAIAMVRQLQPNALERFTYGRLNPNTIVPVSPGNSSMNVAQFLNASMQACNCYIIPAVSLNESARGTLFNTTNSLLNMPIYKKFKYLSLDDWKGYASRHTANQTKSLFAALYAQGWKGIGVNDCGGYYTTYNSARFADVCIVPKGWQISQGTLNSVGKEPSIRLVLSYIDFPNGMAKFTNLTPDTEANVLMYNVTPSQSTYGYKYVYPIVQTFWDSNHKVTSQIGPYHGNTLYAIMNSLMQQYN